MSKLHTVKPHDGLSSLSLIAGYYKVDFEELVQLNGDHKNISSRARQDPYWGYIDIGDQIRIPTPNGSALKGNKATPDSAEVKKAFESAPPEQAEEPNAVAPSCPLQSGCEVETVVISCDHHGKRGFRLEVNQEKSAFDRENTLQLISSADIKKADSVTIQSVSSCLNGDPECPSLELTSDGQKTAVSNGEKVKVLAQSGPTVTEDFKSFLKHLLLPREVEAKRYVLSGTSCKGARNGLATISVTPQVKWKSNLEVGYFHDTYKDSNFVQNQGYGHLKVMGEWKVKGGIEAAIDESKWKFGGDVSGNAGHQSNNAMSRQVFSKAQGFLDGIMPFMGQVTGDMGKVEIDWPMLSLAGEIENMEREGSSEVGIKGKIALGFNPLVGATIEANIIQLLIDVYTKPFKSVQKILLKAQKAAKEKSGKLKGKAGIDAKAAVTLTAKGSVGGDVEWKNETGADWKCDGKVKAAFGMKLVGDAHIEGVIFTVASGAGAKMEVKGVTAETCEIAGEVYPVTENDELSIGGKVDFSGLAIYYSLYAYIGGEGDKSTESYNEKKRKRRGYDDKSEVSLSGKKEREESKLLCEIVAPKQLYQSGKGKGLSNVEL